MATYIVATEITITRKEGNLADIAFTVPDIFSLTGKTVKFAVEDINGSSIMLKEGADVTIAGQLITIPLLPADTDNHAGKHRWEMNAYDAELQPITIGRGVFVIDKKLL